jgi:hypothetical protein
LLFINRVNHGECLLSCVNFHAALCLVWLIMVSKWDLQEFILQMNGYLYQTFVWKISYIYLHVLLIYIYGTFFSKISCISSDLDFWICNVPTLNLISTCIKTFPQWFYIILIYIYDKMFNSTFYVFHDYIFHDSWIRS